MASPYSAHPNKPAKCEKFVTFLEGLLTELRERRPKRDGEFVDEDPPEDTRPQLMPHYYVATRAMCSVGSLKSWLAQHRDRREENDTSDRLVEAWDRICDEMGEALSSKTLKIAHDTTHPRAFDAQKFLLPKLSPDVFGNREAAAPSRSSDIIPQEAMDALTEGEYARIKELSDATDANNSEFDQIINRAARRALADQVGSGD